jgi:uncharacterized damage-inducible protein DinB
MIATTQIETSRLADQLERSFRGGAWNGPALLEALNGVEAEAATARLAPGVHTIHEIAWHAAFWIDASRRRIEGEDDSGLAPGADFPVEPTDAVAAWGETRERLEAAHRGLHDLVLSLADERLDDPVSGSDPTVRGLLLGLLQHNAYHAGQIVVLRKAQEGR